MGAIDEIFDEPSFKERRRSQVDAINGIPMTLKAYLPNAPASAGHFREALS
jgi:hypothetical protein